MSSDNEVILQRIAAELGSGKVQHDSKGAWEWRGAIEGAMARVRVESSSCEVQVEGQNPLGTFELQWGPKLVPDPSAVDDDAFAVEDTVRVWVGKCVVIECYGLELPEKVGGFRSFPPQATGYLVDGMQRDHVRVLSVMKDEILGHLERGNPDLAAAAVRFARLAAWTAVQLKLCAPYAQQYVQTGAAQAAAPNAQVRCRFCRARFLLSQSGRCASCGAPVE